MRIASRGPVICILHSIKRPWHLYITQLKWLLTYNTTTKLWKDFEWGPVGWGQFLCWSKYYMQHTVECEWTKANMQQENNSQSKLINNYTTIMNLSSRRRSIPCHSRASVNRNASTKCRATDGLPNKCTRPASCSASSSYTRNHGNNLQNA